MRSLAKRLRGKGRRIVFTNGCFDILHAGHVRYLEKAKSLGDILVVGMNSDRSIRKIKDPKRPIVPQAYRAEVLAGLACVDYVICFDEPDPERLIAAIQPHFLVKGRDWPKDRVIGRAIVESRGGKVITIPLIPRLSTSAIIHAVVKKYGPPQSNSRKASK